MPVIRAVCAIFLGAMILGSAEQSNAEDWKGRLAAGIEAGKRGDLDGALKAYGDLLSEPSSPLEVRVAAFNNRGVIHDDLGNYAAALKDFSDALNLDSGWSEAYNNRAITFAKMGELDRAILDFDQALFLSPHDAEIYSNRGVAYGKTGYFEKALRDFNRSLRLRPDDPFTLFNRALVYVEMGNKERARVDLLRAAKLLPEDPTISNKIRDLGLETALP